MLMLMLILVVFQLGVGNIVRGTIFFNHIPRFLEEYVVFLQNVYEATTMSQPNAKVEIVQATIPVSVEKYERKHVL